MKRALAVLAVIAVIAAACDDDQSTLDGDPDASTSTTEGSTPSTVPILADFSWSMPARFGLDANLNGRIDVPNTFEYAHNLAPGSCPSGCPAAAPTFTVELSGAGSTSEVGPIEEYSWEIRSGAELIVEAATPDAATEIRLAEGSYVVSLTVAAGGQTSTVTEDIDIRDYLLVGIGDSYASGEGNPETTEVDSSGRLPRAVGIWADDGGDGAGPVVERHRRAHRSTLAATPQAALHLEGRDEHSSVTLLFVAASGASIDEGLIGPQSEVSGAAADEIELPPQVDAIAAMLGCITSAEGPKCDRTIDALTISIGGNDVGFSLVFGGLVVADPEFGFRSVYDFAVNQIFSLAESKTRDLVEQYAALDEAIRARLEVEQILLVGYPSATGSGDHLCQQIATDLVAGLEVDGEEIIQTVDRVVVPLGATMAQAAAAHGWVYVDGHLDDFAPHGYCGNEPYPAAAYPGNPFPAPVTPSADPAVRWFRQADESADIQGVQDETFRPTDLATEGTLHPNELGHLSMRDSLLAALDLD